MKFTRVFPYRKRFVADFEKDRDTIKILTGIEITKKDYKDYGGTNRSRHIHRAYNENICDIYKDNPACLAAQLLNELENDGMTITEKMESQIGTNLPKDTPEEVAIAKEFIEKIKEHTRHFILKKRQQPE